MVEPAFCSLRKTLDVLMVRGQAAEPAGRAGAVVFASDPKALRGSLLKFKEGKEVDGGGQFAAVRVFQGVHVDGEVTTLKVSLTGGGTPAACKWMTKEELDEKVKSVVVGVLADAKEARSSKGKGVAEVSRRHDVVLSVVEKEGGFRELRAVTSKGAMQYTRETTVETAVSEYSMQWLPWTEEGGGAAQPPAPEHADLVPKELYLNPEPAVAQGDETDEDYGFCGVVGWPEMLVQLGLLDGEPAELRQGGSLQCDDMQVGELCDLAHNLVGHLEGEPGTDTLLQYMAGREEQKMLLQAVLDFGYKLEAAYPRLLPSAAESAYQVVYKMGPLSGGLMHRGTAGIHAMHIAAEVRDYEEPEHWDCDPRGNFMPRAELARLERRRAFDGATAAVAAARALGGVASPGHRSQGGSRASSPGLGQLALTGFATPRVGGQAGSRPGSPLVPGGSSPGSPGPGSPALAMFASHLAVRPTDQGVDSPQLQAPAPRGGVLTPPPQMMYHQSQQQQQQAQQQGPQGGQGPHMSSLQQQQLAQAQVQVQYLQQQQQQQQQQHQQQQQQQGLQQQQQQQQQQVQQQGQVQWQMQQQQQQQQQPQQQPPWQMQMGQRPPPPPPPPQMPQQQVPVQQQQPWGQGLVAVAGAAALSMHHPAITDFIPLGREGDSPRQIVDAMGGETMQRTLATLRPPPPGVQPANWTGRDLFESFVPLNSDQAAEATLGDIRDLHIALVQQGVRAVPGAGPRPVDYTQAHGRLRTLVAQAAAVRPQPAAVAPGGAAQPLRAPDGTASTLESGTADDRKYEACVPMSRLHPLQRVEYIVSEARVAQTPAVLSLSPEAAVARCVNQGEPIGSAAFAYHFSSATTEDKASGSIATSIKGARGALVESLVEHRVAAMGGVLERNVTAAHKNELRVFFGGFLYGKLSSREVTRFFAWVMPDQDRGAQPGTLAGGRPGNPDERGDFMRAMPLVFKDMTRAWGDAAGCELGPDGVFGIRHVYEDISLRMDMQRMHAVFDDIYRGIFRAFARCRTQNGLNYHVSELPGATNPHRTMIGGYLRPNLCNVVVVYGTYTVEPEQKEQKEDERLERKWNKRMDERGGAGHQSSTEVSALAAQVGDMQRQLNAYKRGAPTQPTVAGGPPPPPPGGPPVVQQQQVVKQQRVQQPLQPVVASGAPQIPTPRDPGDVTIPARDPVKLVERYEWELHKAGKPSSCGWLALFDACKTGGSGKRCPRCAAGLVTPDKDAFLAVAATAMTPQRTGELDAVKAKRGWG